MYINLRDPHVTYQNSNKGKQSHEAEVQPIKLINTQ